MNMVNSRRGALLSYRSVFAPDSFSDQTIVVTGGGSGIGRCTAHELAALGAHVVLIGRKQEKLTRVVEEIAEDRGQCSSYAIDIRNEESVAKTVRHIVRERGTIHGLVNNAGGQYPAMVKTISKKGWEAVVSSNLTGGFLMSREVFNQSMCQTGGSIVNMLANMWGGMPGKAHSGAARAGMLNFTQTAAVEWAASGVRVNAVAPGGIASSGLDSYEAEARRDIVPKLRGSAPLKRLGEEAEVSAAIVFLLCEAASFITGSCLEIDGGASLNSALVSLPEHDRSRPYRGFHRAVRPKALDEIETELKILVQPELEQLE